MADALSHIVTARITGLGSRDADVRLLLCVGVVLPDILEKFLVVVGGAPPFYALPTHTVAGIVLISYLFALLFEEVLRRAVFVAFLAGGMLHLVLDCFKDNVGPPSEYALFPFWDGGLEMGAYRTEDVVYALPVNLAILLGLFFVVRRRG